MKNKDYFPEESVVKDSIYMMMKDTIICKLCNKIIKNPMMCTNCQKTYCKNCLNNWVNTCPNNCENPNYVENKSAIDILSKLKYECQNCGKQIKSKDINSHLDSNCIKKSKNPKNLAKHYEYSHLKKLKKWKIKAKKFLIYQVRKNKFFYTYFSYYIRSIFYWKNIFNTYVTKYLI